MFSNDNNVESIANLIESIKTYIGDKTEYFKLDVIEKVVRLATVISIIIVVSLLLIIAMIYFSFSAAFALEPIVGKALAFIIVGCFYIILLLLFLAFHKSLIERPLVRFLSGLLLK